jgi:hypothetical protein
VRTARLAVSHFGSQPLQFLLQPLVEQVLPQQLRFQFRDPLLLCIRKLIFIPSAAHAHQFNIPSSTSARVFRPVFLQTFDTLQNAAFER